MAVGSGIRRRIKKLIINVRWSAVAPVPYMHARSSCVLASLINQRGERERIKPFYYATDGESDLSRAAVSEVESTLADRAPAHSGCLIN